MFYHSMNSISQVYILPGESYNRSLSVCGVILLRLRVPIVAQNSWKPPTADIYKINSDGSFDPSSRSGGWGFVVRDSSGEVLAAGAGNITYAASSLQAEAIAVYKSILQAARLGMTRIILEMDATVLASALKSCCVDQSAIGGLVYQIRDIMCDDFSCCTVSVCNRSCNKVADCLAFYGAYVLFSGSEVFMNQYQTM